MNFDQTNISIIPCGNWTMEEEGKVFILFCYVLLYFIFIVTINSGQTKKYFVDNFCFS